MNFVWGAVDWAIILIWDYVQAWYLKFVQIICLGLKMW
jgi:hypothetical protein